MRDGKKLGIKIEDIISLYESGLLPIQIGEKFGCTTSNITRRLRKSGIIVNRDYSKRRYSRINRHKVNELYFDDINTEQKAYFLGLMFSDGSVSRTQFYLKMIDYDIVYKFKVALESDVEIITRNDNVPTHNTSYILLISSKRMCDVLSSWGCTPNKTRTIRFPNIEAKFYPHFIRGFFDGDGCIGLDAKIYHCYFDIVSASKLFLEDIRPIITENAITDGRIQKEKNYNIWHLRYNGHQIIKILDWLYKDATVYLNRKYFKYTLLSSSKTGLIAGKP